MLKKNGCVLFVCVILLITPHVLFAEVKGHIVQLKRVRVDNAYTPRVLGLFIGIREYHDPYWYDLKYPEKDVRDMVRFFSENHTLSLDEKIILTTPEETGKDVIVSEKLPEFAKLNTSTKDIVIVYVSSHGTLRREIVPIAVGGKNETEPKRVPYILTSDSREEDIKYSAIPLYQFINWFENLKSQRKVLILDMCHSGRFGKSQISKDDLEELTSSKGIHYAAFEDSKASIILSACPMGGISYEDNHLQNSVYTHFLIEGMRNGDLNLDGAVSISEAHNYAIDKTRQFTWSKKEYKQTPTAYSKILGRDPILVSGMISNTGNSTLFSYSSANQGVDIYLDKTYMGMLPKGVPVEPGEHRVECRIGGEVVFSESLNVSPGYDYMLPGFDIFAATQPKMMYALETGIEGFTGNDVPDKLVPAESFLSLSFYRYNLKKRWLAMSWGMGTGFGEDLRRYTARLGLKYTRSFGKARVFVGPDVHLSLFDYQSDIIEEKKVDSNMSFLGPGLDCLWMYPFSKTTVMFGLRSSYLPYEINSETHHVFSFAGVFSVGYSL